MKIAFLKLNMFGRRSADAMAPLIFAIVKALTPGDVPIAFYDENVETIPANLDADAVAMTVDTFSARRAYQLSAVFRAQGHKVIMGGFHPTMLPEECLHHADAVVCGEAEDTWPKVIGDLKSGALQRKYVSQNNADLSKLAYDYSAFSGKNYNSIGMVQFSRGCKFSCDFCSIHAFYSDTVRCRDPKTIAAEIRQRGERLLFFIDDNLFADEAKARELFQALIPLKKKWFCQISIDAARDTELLKLMKQSGCVAVLIGFESLNTDNLKQMKKGANLKNADYDQSIANLYACNLMIYGTFVIGYDSDTRDTIRHLVKFATKNKFLLANFNPLMPMPGTRLYERLKEENKLVYERWWTDVNYSYGDAMLLPQKLTTAELMQGCREARFAYYSLRNILYRLLHRKANACSLLNLIIFFTANWISRKEIRAKQGRRLGGQVKNNSD